MAGELLGRTAVVAFCLLFAVTGVRAMLNPDRFLRHSGGEMLKTWNRDGMRLTGAVIVAAAIYMLYHAGCLRKRESLPGARIPKEVWSPLGRHAVTCPTRARVVELNP